MSSVGAGEAAADGAAEGEVGLALPAGVGAGVGVGTVQNPQLRSHMPAPRHVGQRMTEQAPWAAADAQVSPGE